TDVEYFRQSRALGPCPRGTPSASVPRPPILTAVPSALAEPAVTGSPQSITTSPPSRPPGIRLSRPNEIRADRHSKRGQAMDTIGEVHGGSETRRSAGTGRAAPRGDRRSLGRPGAPLRAMRPWLGLFLGIAGGALAISLALGLLVVLTASVAHA